jgi:hypothetical protein
MCRGPRRDCTIFETSSIFFLCGVIGIVVLRCFVHHSFWERSLVIDEIQDRVTLHTMSFFNGSSFGRCCLGSLDLRPVNWFVEVVCECYCETYEYAMIGSIPCHSNSFTTITYEFQFLDVHKCC